MYSYTRYVFGPLKWRKIARVHVIERYMLKKDDKEFAMMKSTLWQPEINFFEWVMIH